jgi:hypothetical protein
MTTGAKSNPWTSEMPELRGPWLGQGTPGSESTDFCPEILGTEQRVAGITFSPEGDEAFFTMNTSVDSAKLMWMQMVDGVWTKPQPAPFNSAQIDNDICMSPDGLRLCWRSWRPLPGSTAPEERPSLWATDRTADGWSDPFPIECGGETQLAWYPSIAGSGTLYFSARKSPDEYCVYRARRTANTYETREPILCGMESGGDLCIAPDESFLVVTCFSHPHFQGVGKLHVSFRTPAGEWTPLQDIGPSINTELVEYCPTISADGRRLFFCRLDREAKHARTYWVDAGVIERLRPASRA